jgi:hypothetical protein
MPEARLLFRDDGYPRSNPGDRRNNDLFRNPVRFRDRRPVGFGGWGRSARKNLHDFASCAQDSGIESVGQPGGNGQSHSGNDLKGCAVVEYSLAAQVRALNRQLVASARDGGAKATFSTEFCPIFGILPIHPPVALLAMKWQKSGT